MPPLANLSDAACSILTIMFAFNTLLGDGSTNSFTNNVVVAIDNLRRITVSYMHIRAATLFPNS